MTNHLFLVLENTLYGAAFLSGLIVATAMAITQGAFSGGCVLYGEAEVKAGGVASVAHFGNVSACTFPLAAGVMGAVYAFCSILYWLHAACTEDARRPAWWGGVASVVAGVLALLLLVSGCVLRVGLGRWCESLITASAKVHPLHSCRDAQALNWTDSHNGARFYDNVISGETAVWVDLLVWVGCVVLLAVRGRVHGEPPFSALPAPASWSESSVGEHTPILSPTVT
ncbi:unnamed protein product [Lampetra fluviatilis]